jgi:hypothetical protein
MTIPPEAEPEHFVHDGFEREVSPAVEATVDPAAATTRFLRYRTLVEQRCGARSRSTDKFMPRQPQKIAP